MTVLHPPQTRAGRSTPRRAGAEVVVGIVDPDGLVGPLDTLLPRRWSIRRHPDLYEVTRPDLLVLGSATPYLTAAARLLHPGATLVTVIGPDEPVRMIADILHSGADGCVRAGAPHLLASALLSDHQRRTRLRRRPAWR